MVIQADVKPEETALSGSLTFSILSKEDLGTLRTYPLMRNFLRLDSAA